MLHYVHLANCYPDLNLGASQQTRYHVATTWWREIRSNRITFVWCCAAAYSHASRLHWLMLRITTTGDNELLLLSLNVKVGIRCITAVFLHIPLSLLADSFASVFTDKICTRRLQCSQKSSHAPPKTTLHICRPDIYVGIKHCNSVIRHHHCAIDRQANQSTETKATMINFRRPACTMLLRSLYRQPLWKAAEPTAIITLHINRLFTQQKEISNYERNLTIIPSSIWSSITEVYKQGAWTQH